MQKIWRYGINFCRFRFQEIEAVYRRLDIKFDHTTARVFITRCWKGWFQSLVDQGLAVTSEGAICIFLEGFDAR